MINFFKQSVVDVEVNVSVEDFVIKHLEEVHAFEDEYDFYIHNGGVMQRVLTVPQKDCPIGYLMSNSSIIEGLNHYYKNKRSQSLSQ